MAIEGLEQGYNLLLLLFTGLFVTGLGVYLVINPDMGMQPAGPRQFTDYLTGVGAILAGLIILGFCAWVFFRKDKPEQE
jgi:drug/metabolite transporter (DMT)-like permease